MKNPFQPVALDEWHSIQAAMLYSYASANRLKLLHAIVTKFIDGLVDPLLDLAKAQDRDRLVTDQRWGERDTSSNWANNAWPFLKDLQKSLAGDIARRSSGEYRPTDTDQCLRGAEQYSMLWASNAEEERYRGAVKLINYYAGPIDSVLYHPHNRWDDYTFMYHYPEFLSENPTRPVFRIRNDIVGTTGKLPPETGVYVSADDPHAALQFAWTGKQGCELRPANTFNALGLAALRWVGRADLWRDEAKMFEFATRSEYKNMLSPQLEVLGEVYPELAPSTVAGAAFERRPSTWYLVERLDEPWIATALSWRTRAAPTTRCRSRAVTSAPSVDITTHLHGKTPGASSLPTKLRRYSTPIMVQRSGNWTRITKRDVFRIDAPCRTPCDSTLRNARLCDV